MSERTSPLNRLNKNFNSSADVFSSGKLQFGLQPAAEWTAILVFSLLTALMILVGAGRFVNIIFPVGSLAVGVFLYFRTPLLYMGFFWWLWFLTPLIRRLTDYRSSYTEPSPILLAPYIVGLITLITFFKYLPNIDRLGGWPFLLSASGVFYGLLNGLINKDAFPVARDCLDWLIPILFGFYLLVNWRDYPAYRNNIRRVFTWGLLVTGTYGIYQYIKLPDWDNFWIKNVGMSSIFVDQPDKFGAVRSFSTMQATEVFSAFLAAALLLLLTSPGVLRLPASIVGYAAFLLTFARSAWLGWLAGLLVLGSSLKAKLQMRLIVIICAIAVCVVPLATMEPFSNKLEKRFNTFSDLHKDNSTRGRAKEFRSSFVPALENGVGEGLGGSGFDNNFLAILIKLGWLGSVLYISGLAFLIFALFQSSASSFDPFIASARAIAITAIVRIPVNGSLLGVSGLLLWGFFGIGLAADRYYQKFGKITTNRP